MLDFFVNLSNHPSTGLVFVFILYSIMVYMVLEPSFKTYRDKGKKANGKVDISEPATVILSTDRGAKVKAISKHSFTIVYGGRTIFSNKFSAGAHLVEFEIEHPAQLSLLEGSNVDIEIEANNGEVSIEVPTGPHRKTMGLIAATILTLVVLYPYILIAFP